MTAAHDLSAALQASARDDLHLAAIRAWQALARQQPAPAMDPAVLFQELHDLFAPGASITPVEQLIADWYELARQCGLDVNDEDGELRPDIDEAITRVVTAAIWFGITSGHHAIAGSSHSIPPQVRGAGMIPSLPGSTSPAETGTFADGDPDASLDDQAACLFTIACWCITSARAELSGNGWDAGQEAALTHSFKNLTDTWTTYKGVLAFLPGADGQADRPTREQVLADLEKPRRAFASALVAYNARLLKAAALFDVKRAAAGQDRQGTVTLSAAGTET
jgi:hypothetical protein